MSTTVDWQIVLVDLLNTTPVIEGQMVDQLDGRWLRAHGGPKDVDDVRTVRDDLQRVVRMESDASVLRRYLADARKLPDIGPDGVEWTLEADWQARVVLAWGELEREMPGRLRPCANHDCRLFLLDRSRAGTARWCSMSGCGNRMKARRHYSRTRRG
ncbi:CGNR zinc finger domain-containing protein [Mycobacterium sp. ACS1612]|uniref:CGNR zinc finger domain-containing protein n=1 Tax=Mycobacterium sp. ACS1612 TaxID=1834117 RepID=UPI001E55D46C|nr:CGNR zinc finger domain-containing protein [Mycobacterium sp. ACS1612]